jgi:hypothetical protein
VATQRERTTGELDEQILLLMKEKTCIQYKNHFGVSSILPKRAGTTLDAVYSDDEKLTYSTKRTLANFEPWLA